jgi:tripartite ATP-independent transporter DctM subunit
MTVVAVAFAALFALLLLEVPIAFGMAAVGLAGLMHFIGPNAAFSMLGTIASETVLNYDLAVLPLFVLMGNFVARSGISQNLYDASNAFVGHLRGGLAMATVVACGGFSAVCGSSLATAATMSKVALPPMRRYGYADSLATGSVAAGGTLGILIPPSVLMVLYGIMTQTDIGKLFIAGILPGIIGIIGYMAAVYVATRIDPKLGPPGERTPWPSRLRSLRGVSGMAGLFFLIIGGIYFGVFTPNEAAGIGAFGAFAVALARRSLSTRAIVEVLVETGRTSAMMFTVLIGALLFANFINIARMPNIVADWFKSLEVAPIVVIIVMIAVYVALGCILESFSMILLTVPIFYPIVANLGFDLVWFGILIVVVTEISLITPPIGLNVFMLKAMVPEVSTTTIFRGVIPFIGADVVRVMLLAFVPAISLFLPGFMR